MKGKTNTVVLLILLLTGCSINKLVPPPYAGAFVEHDRFTGLQAKIPMGNAAYLLVIQFGWGSHVLSVVPVFTNQLYAAPVSDTFSLGQSVNPFNTKIDEDLITGWENQPPPARYNIFAPPLTLQTR